MRKTKRPENIQLLDSELVAQQRLLERKLQDQMRGRLYNIISNQSFNPYSPGHGRLAYGASIKALQRNIEDSLKTDINQKTWEYNKRIAEPMNAFNLKQSVHNLQ